MGNGLYYDENGEYIDRNLGNNPFTIDFSDDAAYIPNSTVLMDGTEWDKEHPNYANHKY